MKTEFNQDIIENVILNANSMLFDLDLYQELAALHFGFFAWLKKRRMVEEFTTLYVALWRFALDRSFPENSEFLYTSFMRQEKLFSKSRKVKSVQKIDFYYSKLTDKKEHDFSAIAEHLLSFAEVREAKKKAANLKLSLILRAKYQFFFDNLLYS